MFVRKLLNGANSEKVLIDHFLIDLSIFPTMTIDG